MKHRRNIEFSPKMLLIFLTALCVLLLSVSVIFKEVTKPFGNIVATVVIPMQDGINSVGVWVSDRFTSRKTMEELQELFALQQEYASYKTVGARVISNGSGNWYENFIINKGSSDGITENMNVLADNGLVGIVTDVGRNYAKVQSIISDGSSVSAMSTTSSDNCVVQGNSETMNRDGNIDVAYISKDATMKAGDELVTSNISSRYLPGLRIGTVSDITMDSSNLTQSAKVTPVVDFQHIDEVLVITQLKKVPADSESAE